MSINILELSLKDNIPIDMLENLIFKSMPFVSRIVSSDEYWDIPQEDRASALGINVKYQDCGYKTLLDAYVEHEVYGKELGKIAKCISKISGSDVAIGDYINDVEFATGRFIIFHPTGTCSFALEEYLNGTFDLVEISSPCSSIELDVDGAGHSEC
jgi:hypothetical protein